MTLDDFREFDRYGRIPMKNVRLLSASLILFVSMFTGRAGAASYSSDMSDLWWASPAGSESGWGIQLVQRSATIFATMFVYGPDGAPTWYVATMIPTASQFTWSGDLYATTGPWFATVPFDPTRVAVRKVGTMAFASNTVFDATLSYTVDGAAVTKNITRETLVNENYNGHYGGLVHETVVTCADAARNGTFETAPILNIVQNDTSFTLERLPSNGSSCTYTGTLSQSGQMGDVQGNYRCSDGSAGIFRIVELQVTEIGMNGRFAFAATPPAGCQGLGWFGGTRVNTF
jgi:hypothetical protein